MNEDQAKGVVAVIMTAWPRVDWAPTTTALWLDTLAPLHPEDALQAARALTVESEHPPALAALMKRASDFTRRRQMAEQPQALEPASTMPEIPRAWLAEMRDQVAGLDLSPGRERKPSKHLPYKDWDSCPTCIAVNAEIRAATVYS